MKHAMSLYSPVRPLEKLCLGYALVCTAHRSALVTVYGCSLSMASWCLQTLVVAEAKEEEGEAGDSADVAADISLL